MNGRYSIHGSPVDGDGLFGLGVLETGRLLGDEFRTTGVSKQPGSHVSHRPGGVLYRSFTYHYVMSLFSY